MADRRAALRVAIPLLLVVAVAAAAVWWLSDDGDGATVEPVAITAEGPRFQDLGELVAASELVVVGEVVAVDEGRTITDPSDPAVGVVTQLADVTVTDVVVGEHAGPLVVEQEATLLDGRPVIVNGVAPLAVGDEGLMFLVRGAGEEFPYTAFVNEQGWVPIVDGAVVVDPDDPLWEDLATQSIEAALSAVRSASG